LVLFPNTQFKLYKLGSGDPDEYGEKETLEEVGVFVGDFQADMPGRDEKGFGDIAITSFRLYADPSVPFDELGDKCIIEIDGEQYYIIGVPIKYKTLIPYWKVRLARKIVQEDRIGW